MTTAKVILNPAGLIRRIPLKSHELTSAITPQSSLFTLAHIGLPQVDIKTWRLDVGGAVERPYQLTFDELQRLPRHNIESFHQCAGFPRRPDLATRRIANVIWSGVAVDDVLAKAGIKSGAQFLWAYGLDRGDFEGREDQYVKDVPLDRLDEGGCLLAYEVNGEPLAPEHGYPVRLVVPGFYGTNSVKWVCRLDVAETRYSGTFTRVLYNDPIPEGNGFRPVWEAGPESLIVGPADGSTVRKGPNEIWGWAWGRRAIAKVEVSCNGGESWNQASLEERRDWAWQRFKFDWAPSTPGPHTLIARAVDATGRTQPPQSARNAIHSVSITVI